ncbi:hypothetical protein ABZ403_08965 [Micromonospora zamorensis]
MVKPILGIFIPWTDVEALRKRHRSLPSSRSVQPVTAAAPAGCPGHPL